jgi:hypothetical protein
VLARLPPDNAAALTEPIVPRWSANRKPSGFHGGSRLPSSDWLVTAGAFYRDLTMSAKSPFSDSRMASISWALAITRASADSTGKTSLKHMTS